MSGYLDTPCRTIEQAAEDTRNECLVELAMERIIERLTRMGMSHDGIEHELEIQNAE